MPGFPRRRSNKLNSLTLKNSGRPRQGATAVGGREVLLVQCITDTAETTGNPDCQASGQVRKVGEAKEVVNHR